MDVDECQLKSDSCHEKANCFNQIGTFTCVCMDGFLGNGKSCKSPDSVLVLYGSAPAKLINPVLNYRQTVDCFEKEQENLAFMCPITWQNKLHLFGGYMMKIARLDGYKLNYLDKNLDFMHIGGACSVMNNEFIFLCFAQPSNTCRRTSDPLETFEEIALAKTNHYATATSASPSKRAIYPYTIIVITYDSYGNNNLQV